MKIYNSTCCVDGFGADEVPALEDHVYKNKKKAFAHSMELIKGNFKNRKAKNNTKKSLEQFCKDLQGILY